MILTSLHALASTFLGTREVVGPGYNPLISAMLRECEDWIEGDETPWCGALIAFCCRRLGLPIPPAPLTARHWTQVGESVGLLAARPEDDIVILSRAGSPSLGHVAIFDRLDTGSSKVWLLGGNQGDAVCVAPFDAVNIVGVRRLAS